MWMRVTDSSCLTLILYDTIDFFHFWYKFGNNGLIYNQLSCHAVAV